VSWEQQLWRSLHLQTTIMHRQGWRGWAYDLSPPAGMGATETYWLSSASREKYTSLEISLRGILAGKYSWLLSYVRSSAWSSAVLDLSLENLVYGRQGSGPADWDVPNRLISNGIVPVPKFKRLTLAYFLEWHTGFPYGAVDDMERRVGEANSLRYPDYFPLNLHLERRFRFWKTEWALRAGYNNITDSRNPVIVNNNIMSPQFGDFRGGQGRVFTGRLRFLGKS
jgi:hypothetical protein